MVYLGLSWSILGYLGLSQAISGYLKISMAISGYILLSWPVSANLSLFWGIPGLYPVKYAISAGERKLLQFKLFCYLFILFYFV